MQSEFDLADGNDITVFDLHRGNHLELVDIGLVGAPEVTDIPCIVLAVDDAMAIRYQFVGELDGAICAPSNDRVVIDFVDFVALQQRRAGTLDDQKDRRARERRQVLVAADDGPKNPPHKYINQTDKRQSECPDDEFNRGVGQFIHRYVQSST